LEAGVSDGILAGHANCFCTLDLYYFVDNFFSPVIDADSVTDKISYSAVLNG